MKKLLLLILSCFIITTTLCQAQTYTISTYAGNGTAGYSGDNGQATSAELNDPYGVVVDTSGNVYITDALNSVIRKVNTDGIISTFAGGGNNGLGDGGQATAAELNYPIGIAVDDSGNVYIAEFGNQRIRKVNTSGIISTIAGDGITGYYGDGGQATAAELGNPSGVACDGSGNVYIGEANQRIRKVNTSGVISTFAGNGTPGYSGDGGQATAAELYLPSGVAIDTSGNVYIADMVNNVIRKVNTKGIISTYAGNGYNAGTGNGGYSGDDGQATAAELWFPTDVTVDDTGNVYIVDSYNNVIRKVNTSGIISTIAGDGTPGYSGDGGQATEAELNSPYTVAIGSSVNFYIADRSNRRIRKLCPTIATPGTINGSTIFNSGSSQTYSIAAVTGATSYTWTLPSGWTGSSTTTSITALTGCSGTITVTANNACGSSNPQNLYVAAEEPAQPIAIKGDTMICRPGSSQTYSIAAVTGATSYTWTLPSGWTGNSTDTSITVTSNTNGGLISVTANNNCGSGPAQTLTVTIFYQAPTPILWGTTSGGGKFGAGTIFLSSSAGAEMDVYDFSLDSASQDPFGSLIQASNGLLYGLSSGYNAIYGGSAGSIFSYNILTRTESDLYDFGNAPDGQSPFGSLIQWSNGLLYGMTYGGGAYLDGTIFSYNITTNSETDVHDFNGGYPIYDGVQPYGSLLQLKYIYNGDLYGMTTSGGLYDSLGNYYIGNGTIFGYYPGISYELDYSFGEGTDGKTPYGSLIQASDSLLYGMTSTGGLNYHHYGTIFSYNLSTEKETVLYDFKGGTDGQSPYSNKLIQASNGLLYGMTPYGGTYDSGIIFSYNISTKTETVLHSFGNGNDGKYPEGSLIQASDGLLYGTTFSGGTKDSGTVFSYNISTGTETIIHNFQGGTDGSRPYSDLVEVDTPSNIFVAPLESNICEGNSVTLTAISSTAYTYTWAPATGLSATTGYSVIANPAVTTTYTITGTTFCGTKSVSETVTVNPNPTITLSTSSVICDGDSTTLTASGGLTYVWLPATGLSVTTGDSVIANPTETTVYTVIGTNSAGCTSSLTDTITINTCGYVWPGDANDDLIVNNYDLIPIGLYYGETGTARDTTTNTWAPHPAKNWGSLESDGYDKKFVDCNGDGIINSDDTLAVSLNYGLTHLYHSPRSGSSKERSGGTPLYFVTDSSSYHAGSKVHVAVWLGNVTTQIVNVYGLGYDIDIDTSLIQPGTLAFNYDNSFIGTKNINTLSLTHIGDDVETAVVGTDHTNKNGYGKIGDLYFTLNSSINNPNFLISFSSSLGVDSVGNPLIIQPVNDTLNVTTGINQLSSNDNHLTIYPNPTSGQFIIKLENNQNDYSVEIYNVIGEKIYQSVLSNSQNIIDLSSQPEGMYFIYLKSKERIEVDKVLVIK